MAAAALISSSLCCYSSIRYVRTPDYCQRSASTFPKVGTAFATGSPLLIQRPTYLRKVTCNSKSASVRCEQSTNEGGVDMWLGRLAMVGFASAISVEIATGKGLLENFGLVTPLPTVALSVTALVGVLTAVFIFQSASKSE